VAGILPGPVAAWFHLLYERTGINFSIFYDPFDARTFVHGLALTIELSIICVAGSVVVGIAGAWMEGSHSAWTRRGVRVYVQLFRNTPPLVQLYFFYFGLSALLPQVKGAFGVPSPLLSGLDWAIISLTLFAGAFNVEIFRAGIEAVPGVTIEAARSLGYTRVQIFRYVVLPLAVRISLPALSNNLVNLVKTTTLAYAIAVPELLYASNQIWSDDANVPEMMVVLLVVYLVLVGLLVWGMSALERSLRRPGIGA
jgi:polar amino acid transport system permease protein